MSAWQRQLIFLWQTDELRLDRPEPLDEAMNALYYLDDLAKHTVPEVLNDFARELKRLNIDLPVTARPLTFRYVDRWRP